MTEMEQLEQNAKLEYAKQRASEIKDYILELLEKRADLFRWKMRADTMEAFAIVCYMGLMIYSLIAEIPEEVLHVSADWYFLIIFICMIRAWYHHSRWRAIEGEWKGMVTTMKLLGHDIFEDDDGDKSKTKVKRKSMFARFKEFFERVGVNETKEQPA